MRLFFAASFAALAAAAGCPEHPSIGLWEPHRDQVFVNVLEALGLDHFETIEHLNPGLNVNDVRIGKKYTVPYTTPLKASATWTTSSCTPFLQLDDQVATATATPVHGSNATSALKSTVEGSDARSTQESTTPVSSHGKAAAKTGVATGSLTTTKTTLKTTAETVATAKTAKKSKTTWKTIKTTATTPARSDETTTASPTPTHTSAKTPPPQSVEACTCP